MRLDKYLAEATGQSRAEVRKLILKGMATIDDVTCKKADTHVQEANVVALNGQVLSRTEFVYIMLDKPEGVVSAAVDARDTTVVDLVQAQYPRRKLFPAGRLDKTSTGFVLLTDDGVFAHAILAPKHHVAKTYLVQIDKDITQEMVEGFTNGVQLADGSRMYPADLLPNAEDSLCGTVVLTQGVYHQIKRMFGVFEAGVDALRRVEIGGVKLDETLGTGGFRDLTSQELDTMRCAISQ